MTTEELIKILEEYEVFIDDDYGGSYKSIIAYAPDKSISRVHTVIGVLEIIDTFENIQKDKQELIDYLKEQLNECKLSGNDEDYVRADVYEEILNEIEKR